MRRKPRVEFTNPATPAHYCPWCWRIVSPLSDRFVVGGALLTVGFIAGVVTTATFYV